MSNQEIFEKLENEVGSQGMIDVSYCISNLYDIKLHASKTIEALDEYDYERQWWMNKHLELIK